MSDPDSWWHLKTGEYIVTHHRLPVPDPFAYTTAAAKPGYAGEEKTRDFNLTQEWLAQVIWYLVYCLGGFAAVVLWKALLLAAACGLSWWVAARRTGIFFWGLAATLLAAWMAVNFTADRPALLTFFFVPLFLAIFEERRRLWLLPALALIWANCHGGFFLSWIICGAYAADALVRRTSDAKRVFVVSAATVLASGLNPNGFAIIPTLLRYRQGALTSSLVEWSHPYLWGPPYAYDILLYAAALILVISWRRVRPVDWLLFVTFAAASLTAFRNEILIGLLAPILIASYFPLKLRIPGTLPYAAAALLFAVTVWGSARGSFFQLRAATWRYPAGAVSFLQEHNITAPLFNTYEYGGYLIWRGERVFIDGRALSETVYQDYRNIMGSPANSPLRTVTLARYQIGAIVMNSFEYTSGTLYPLAVALAQPSMDEWKLVYEDPQAMIFLRDAPAGMTVLPKYQITDHLESECRMHVEKDPEFSLCARTLGYLFLRNGARDRARQEFGLYLQHPYGDDPEARRAYVQLLTQ
ncbi:MAG TPA: hypothetical protein VG675_15990 [Bryobacteraceae bacterium]|nr:hypothetical protein [Bryobacteraceae bacterium]